MIRPNQSRPEKSRVHDILQGATGEAIPYGSDDMGRNEAWGSVGCDHDTPAFAVASLRRWWDEMGKSRYPEARELFITADAGGCNGYRSRVWKHEGSWCVRSLRRADPGALRSRWAV